MFSPVYEDVSGLFGRPMTTTGYGPAGELHFPTAHFANGGGAQTPPQQQHQQQHQLMHATYPVMDASGNVRQQFSLQQQQQQNLAAPLNSVPFGTLNGSSVIPLEIFLQQQPSGQLTALPGKPAATQTADGVQYFLAASPHPNRTQVLNTTAGGPAGMPRQPGGQQQQQQQQQTVYAVEQGMDGNFYQTTGGMTAIPNSNGNFSSFGANGFPVTSGPIMSTAGGNSNAAGVQGGVLSMSPDQRSRNLVNTTPGLNLQANVNRNVTVGELVGSNASIEVYDPYFKYIYSVPSRTVVHLPPPRLNITRLVLCRNYRPYDPQSCARGGNCKFVHADCDYTKLEARPIHVNYIWRHESLCTYPRLPAGESRWVVQTDGQVVERRTERILVTKGAQALLNRTSSGPLNCCESYEGKGMCCQGERCSLIHIVHVDPFVQGDFKRAPRKFDASASAAPGQTFTTSMVQRSNSSATSGDHSQAQSQVLIQQQQQQQQQQTQQQRTMLACRHTGSPETEGSTTCTAVRPVACSHVATPTESVVLSTTLERLQEIVDSQRDASSTTGAVNRPQLALSFGISLTAFAVQTLTSATSAGTLLYLPRGAMEAVVVGPVGTTESAATGSEQASRSLRG